MPATPAQIELLAGLERRRVAASLERRIDDLADLLHDDFVFVHSSGRVDSRADYLSVLSSGAHTYETKLRPGRKECQRQPGRDRQERIIRSNVARWITGRPGS
jgi:hypothetical protein